ncbi:hypothetical protein SAMN04488038_11513 [Solimonas aquatica]|uniref:Beta-lactamase n=1 Tax=Solimonas aquatica TaxID=489703 RepID=A0A1H9L5I0_9GAMM|nr:hypothetical protein [Solimonas aquatica]SER06407.1 hypothetical protein SAMN04488038_11513 [Solimonas aquatica]
MSRAHAATWLTLLCLLLTQGAGAQTQSTRIAAARNAALNQKACQKIQPFWWEVGDGTGLIVGEGSPQSETTYARSTGLLIASASKWWFGAYVAELHGGVLTAADLQATRMLSGYRNESYTSCTRSNAATQAALTVGQCFQAGINDRQTPGSIGYFYYDAGHLQKYAALDLGLGSANSAQLGTELNARLGSELGTAFDSPQPGGGGLSDAAHYAVFLQKLLRGTLKLSSLLGSNSVCAWEDHSTPVPAKKSCTAQYTPVPTSMHWRYSIAHWVEDDGSYSSPGAFGFYPWIDASRQFYGLLVREDHSLSAYVDSAACGRLIRQAYLNPPAP